MSIETLRQAYPWPDQSPAMPFNGRGWCTENRWTFFRPRVGNYRTILEVGSWLGSSCRMFMELAPQSTIICVDAWQGLPGESPAGDALYAQFLSNQWASRNRIIPVRANSVDGMRIVAEHVQPDLVYIDADHSYQSVLDDVTAAVELFPDAHITGDDYENDGGAVKRAVKEVAERFGRGIYAEWCWELLRLDTGAALPRSAA